MPSFAAFFSNFYKLSPELSSGLILVGCAPGGTASNLVTLIAKADLALSILFFNSLSQNLHHLHCRASSPHFYTFTT
mgnify:CR=1 FL=1